MPILFIALLLLTFATPSLAASPRQDESCMRLHLEEAITLNTERSKLYAELSEGASRPLSQLLVASERLGILGALALEYLERPLRQAGLHILCEDLVSMSLTPPLFEGPYSPPLTHFASSTTESVRTDLNQAWSQGGYEQLWIQSYHWLDKLKQEPDYHCMVHHLIESIGRAAALAPQQLERAESIGHPRRARIVIDTFIRAQIDLLLIGRQIDRMAAPLQAKGIPIICRDVPSIPVPKPGL